MATAYSEFLSGAKQTQSTLPHDIMENIKLVITAHPTDGRKNINCSGKYNHQNDNIHVKQSTVSQNILRNCHDILKNCNDILFAVTKKKKNQSYMHHKSVSPQPTVLLNITIYRI
jgi:hypothetical protein